jgi:heptosyltransferase I
MPRLLIIKPSSLGDIVHGLQLVASLREQVPDLRVDWVVRDLFAPLVRQAVDVERVIVFERRGGWGALWRLRREIRAERYDFVFDLQGLARSGLMTAVARAGRKVGRSDAREGARWFYDAVVPLPPAGRSSHAMEILLQFAPVLGAKPELRGQVKFRLPAEPLEGVFGEGAAAGESSRRVILFPDSRRPEKCWPHFRVLTERLLLERPDLRLIWAGSERLEGETGWPVGRFANLTGRIPLGSLPSAMARVALVVGNDSGPVHLAAAMGVPVVALFGPTDPQRFGPYPPGAPGRTIVRAPEGRWEQLSVEPVVAAVTAAADGRSQSSQL